jgi:hypothetical protein
MKRVIYFFILLGLSSGYAQENDVIEYDEIVAQMENAASSEYEPNITMGIANGEFNNTAYKLNGQIWNLAPTITKKNLWSLGFDVPFLMGRAGERVSQEVGNVKFRSRFNAWDISPAYSLWVPFSARLAQRGESFILASQHDTYRSGLDIDYKNGKLSNSMGVGYQLRVLENDPKFDVGDILDFHNSLRFAMTESLAAHVSFEFYRIYPTTYKKAELVRTIDWASVSPGLSYDVFGGVFLTAEVVVPVIQSGTPLETDLAFGEIYYPQASTISMNWGLGAGF